MGDSGSAWWFGADRRWRKGRPPRGWRQARDGRWHPLAEDGSAAANGHRPRAGVGSASGDDQTVRHLGTGAGDESGRSPWDRFVAPVSIGVVAVCAIVAIAAVAGIAGVEIGNDARTDGITAVEPMADPPTITRPATTAAAPSPGGSTSTSTSASTSMSTTSSSSTTTSTTEPPRRPPDGPPSGTTGPAPDPFALCTEAQLADFDRGNRPGSWYAERYDPDGDGTFCE